MFYQRKFKLNTPRVKRKWDIFKFPPFRCPVMVENFFDLFIQLHILLKANDQKFVLKNIDLKLFIIKID